MNSVNGNTLDRLAISMAVICGIHCLVTPILLIAVPMIATTFWVDENFHLCMLLLVIPTTTLAVWSGCRRHKDKWVLTSSAVGLGILLAAVVSERAEHAHARAETLAHTLEIEGSSDVFIPASESIKSTTHLTRGGCCALHPAQPITTEATKGAPLTATPSVPWHALLNTLGGLFLVAGHARNFLLCRKDRYSHEENCN